MNTTHDTETDPVGPEDLFWLRVWDRLGELPGTDTDPVRREELLDKAYAACGGRSLAAVTSPEEYAESVHRMHYFLAPSIDSDTLVQGKSALDLQRRQLLRRGVAADLLGP